MNVWVFEAVLHIWLLMIGQHGRKIQQQTCYYQGKVQKNKRKNSFGKVVSYYNFEVVSIEKFKILCKGE